ncbi:HupE/UreJ family protein [Luteolibacter sp. LG18]|uniref:HupE/UreJ family protein n=1 Tax=Luteolibacter sp. LG18 TaxID=2819286 RepID=UPI002B2D7D3F|nr:hypothetical protein llg_32540 [Luteolibacter sp. LG18]
MNRLRLLLRAISLFVALSLQPAPAHNMPNSAVFLDFHRDGVLTELVLPLNELELAFKQPLMAEPDQVLARHGAALQTYVLEHTHPKAPDGREWKIEFRDQAVVMGQVQPDLVVHLWMTPPEGAPLREFTFDFSVIHHEVMNHSTVVSVRNDWNSAVFSSSPEMIGTIQFTITSVQVDRTRGSWWQGFHSVLMLGIHHIAEGTDHLLFLLVLLLPAPLIPAGKRWGGFGGLKRGATKLLKIVTAFTIGHSLTLLAGAIGWLRLPSQPVEVLIAFSILVSAIHAIRPWFPGRETWIASGFGLIHGLAFAGTIAEYGFSPWHLALSVLGFNIGIELMQLAVVLMVVPWLILLSRTRVYTPFRLVGSVFAGLAALAWMGERALSWPNPLNGVIEGFVAHAGWWLAALGVASFAATIWQRRGLPSAGKPG